MKDKIALFCNVDPSAVFTAKDVPSIYEVPLAFHAEGVDDKLAELFNIWSRAPRLEKWEAIVEGVKNPKRGEVRIGIVGKYVELAESYKSLNEALVHGGIAAGVHMKPVFIDSTKLEEGDLSELDDGRRHPGAGRLRHPRHRGEDPGRPPRPRAQGPLLRDLPRPADGGHRVRPQPARPGAGQLAGVRRGHARTRWSPSWRTRRRSPTRAAPCGWAATPACSSEGTKARELYGQDLIHERHRHRFEFNNDYRAPATRRPGWSSRA